MFGDLTNEQLDSIISAVKFARGQMVKENKRAMSRGCRVKFTSSRSGQTMIGEVSDVKRKFIHVKVANSGIWRVPANMLSFAE